MFDSFVQGLASDFARRKYQEAMLACSYRPAFNAAQVQLKQSCIDSVSQSILLEKTVLASLIASILCDYFTGIKTTLSLSLIDAATDSSLEEPPKSRALSALKSAMHFGLYFMVSGQNSAFAFTAMLAELSTRGCGEGRLPVLCRSLTQAASISAAIYCSASGSLSVWASAGLGFFSYASTHLVIGAKAPKSVQAATAFCGIIGTLAMGVATLQSPVNSHLSAE